MFPIVATAVIYVLAVMRLTRLINSDTILDPLRIRVARNATLSYFFSCPWCVGFWLCLGTVWAPMFFADNVGLRYAGFALAASQVVGMMSPLFNDEDIEVVEAD